MGAREPRQPAPTPREQARGHAGDAVTLGAVRPSPTHRSSTTTAVAAQRGRPGPGGEGVGQGVVTPPAPPRGPSSPANTHNFARTSHLCTDTSGKGRSRSGDTVRGADSWGVNSARLPDPQVSSLGPSLGPQFFQPSPSQAVRLRLLRLLRPRRPRRQGGKAPPRGVTMAPAASNSGSRCGRARTPSPAGDPRPGDWNKAFRLGKLQLGLRRNENDPTHFHIFRDCLVPEVASRGASARATLQRPNRCFLLLKCLFSPAAAGCLPSGGGHSWRPLMRELLFLSPRSPGERFRSFQLTVGGQGVGLTAGCNAPTARGSHAGSLSAPAVTRTGGRRADVASGLKPAQMARRPGLGSSCALSE